MQCPECNTTVPNDSVYCPECGATVADGGGHDRQATGGGMQSGDQDGQPQGGQPQGGQQRATPQQQGQQGQPGGQPPRQGGGHPQAAGGGQQPYQMGPSLGDYARMAMDRLPWKGGIIGGALIYGLVFALLALAITTAGSPSPFAPPLLDVAGVVFAGLVTFVSPSDLAVVLELVIQDFPEELTTGAYDALLAPIIMLVPWILYATGRQFVRRRDLDTDDVPGHLGAGTTVVLGTLPIVLFVIVVTAIEAGHTMMVGGIFVPAAAGAFGGLGAWVFADESRASNWGIGVLLGLLSVVIIFALTFMWSVSDAGSVAQNPMLGRLASAVATFVSVSTFGLGTGAIGFLAYLFVIGLVAVAGYVRASPDAGRYGELVSGIRSGASLVAGYSTFVFVSMVLYAGLLTPRGQEMVAMQDWIVFLPKSTLTSMGQASGTFQFVSLPPSILPLTTLQTLGDFLNAFLIGAIVFPLLVGGIGGAIAGYRAMDRTPGMATQRRHQRPGQAQGAPPSGNKSPSGNTPPSGDTSPPTDRTVGEQPAGDDVATQSDGQSGDTGGDTSGSSASGGGGGGSGGE